MNLRVLGCCSPYPKGNDNCPGYLISDDNNNKILLDCGNGCTGLFDMKEDLKNLIVVISHLHHDHYGDLLCLSYVSFLFYNLEIIKEKIKVYLPYPKSADEQIVYNYLHSIKESALDFVPYDDKTEIKFGDLNVSFRQAKHNITTYHAKVSDGNKTIVYSADTAYCDSLTDFTKCADLLICESTFLGRQMKKPKNHMTGFQAGLTARFGKVDKLLLTHFWPEGNREDYVYEACKAFLNTEYAYTNKVMKLGGKYNGK